MIHFKNLCQLRLKLVLTNCFRIQLLYAAGGILQQLHFALNPFQPIAVCHIETIHLLCSEKQMTGFYMKRNTELKWEKISPN